jgi:sulfite reductase (NADPH) flavoprotein alpha-component
VTRVTPRDTPAPEDLSAPRDAFEPGASSAPRDSLLPRDSSPSSQSLAPRDRSIPGDSLTPGDSLEPRGSQQITRARFRHAWFQVHWFIGITAGTLLMLIGLSGATLSFREEILNAMNPGSRYVPPQTVQPLQPQQVLDAVRQSFGDRSVVTVTLFSNTGQATRVNFAPRDRERRSETVYLDPYSGSVLPPAKGAEFFEWVESLHRWLLLPREPGRVATGILASMLLTLALTGIYLRWPKRALDWRAWLTFDTKLTGRSFLRGLHSVTGTVALALYLVSTCTGIYWSFDAIREPIDAALGAPSRSAERIRNNHRGPRADVDMTSAWYTFVEKALAWSEVQIRVPSGNTRTLSFNWLDANPPHERARNQMLVQLSNGAVLEDERHEAKSAGGKFLAAIYPLHMGTYLGLPGRIAMTLGALMLPVFGVTGWMMYLQGRPLRQRARRRQSASVPVADATP